MWGLLVSEEDIPEWAMKSARSVYGKLIYGPGFEKVFQAQDGLIRVHTEKTIRDAALIIVRCRKEAVL